MLESLIQQYGYLALFVGTFLEGETILVVAAFFAHQGYLELPWVVLVAFVGSAAGDQTWFYLGRRYGNRLMTRFPGLKRNTERANRLLKRHENIVILTFRFMYGLRILTPLMLANAGVNPRKFLVLNIIGAFIWALTIGVAGFAFGATLELILGKAKYYEMWALGILLAGRSLWWLSKRLQSYRKPVVDKIE